MPLRYETDGSIAYLTFDRPEAHNAFDPAMMRDFEERIFEFDESPALSVAIITGAGEQAFCAGADLRETAPRVVSKEIASTPSCRVVTLKGVEIWKPIIAAVNGYCLGGGLELLLGTDLRVAAEHATFGLPEVRWGITARGGGTVRLLRQVPRAVAMEMLLTGEQIGAVRAHEVGLVNKVVPLAELMSTAEAYAHKISSNGPLSVRAIKESSHRIDGVPLATAYEIDFELTKPVFSSEDAKEGPRAFIEKRVPRFRGV